MNEAVRRAGDEQLLIFSDADCIPPGRFVERHLAVHEPLSFHVAGCFRWSEETSNRVTVEEIESGRFESIGCERCWKKLRDRRRKSLSKWAELTRRKNRPKVIGLNMACDRALFEAVNGFDERFRMPYLGEDTDLRDRLMRHRPRPRVKVLYTENDVYHLYHPYTEDKPRRATNRAYYDTKRPMRCVMGLEQPEVDPEGAG